MSARARHLGIVLSSASVGLFGLACSAKHDPSPGALMLAVDTNLKVPDDIDAIGISVTSTASKVVSEDATFPVGAGSLAQFPATLAVVRGTSAPVDIRAVGYRNGVAVTIREAVTTIPADHTALLHLDLNWLNEGTVMGSESTSVTELTTTCPAEQAPIGGTCQSFTLDSATLPAFTSTSLGSSADAASSVDIDECFAAASPAPTIRTSDCTFVPSATDINLSLQLPPNSAGWCNAAGCVMPLPNEALDGWILGPDGLIHLPAKICAMTPMPAVMVAAVSAKCPAFSAAHPAHQDYGTTTDQGDATVPPTGADGGTDAGPIADAGGDAAADATVDAGPPPPTYASFPLTGIVAIAVDDTHVFAVTSTAHVYTLDLHFVTGAGPETNIASDVAGLSSVTYVNAAASYPYVALGLSSDGVYVVNASDGTTSAEYVPAETVRNMGMIALGGGNVELSFSGSGQLEAIYTLDLAGGSVVGNAVQRIVQGISVGVEPTLDQGAPRYAYWANVLGENSIFVGSLDAGVEIGPGTQPADTFAFPSADQIAWCDQTDILKLLTLDGGTEQAITQSPAAVQNNLAAADNWVFWTLGDDAVILGSPVTGTLPAGTMPLAVLPDGGTAGPVTHFVARGDQLVWSDANGVYRRTITDLPH